MKEALIKALKELGRVVVLALIPMAIPMLEKWEIDWKLLLVVGIIALLRGIDKYLHELGKEEEDENLILGLTRF